ncbi:MAG: sigma-70 family RNA polymerase sigma factor [Rhizobiaceae bacterium]
MHGKDNAELATLLNASLAGDEKAYAAFLRNGAALIRGYVRRRTAQGGIDVEDVVQETLLAIHLKRHTWRTDSPVLPWLYAIARHKLIDAFRRRGRHVEVDIGDFENDLAAPQDDDRLSERDLGRALDTLAPGQRSVVSSISVDGRSIGETAAALNMNETAVRVALHRGLKALSKRFGQG